MKRILVTGATGFVGTYVVAELLRQGYAVIASARSEASARKMPWYAGIRFLPWDLDQLPGPTNLFEYFERPEALIHLSWQGLPNYKSDFHLLKNLPAHQHFLENLIRNGLADVSVAGTCLEYGMQGGELSETLPTNPSTPYAIAKDRLRRFLESLSNEISFSFKWIRLFYMFGKGQNPNSLLSQLDEAIESGKDSFNMSGGAQIRDYLTIEKMAEYLVRIATQKQYVGIINCCSGQGISVKELVEQYLKANNKRMALNLGYYPYPDYEPMAFWGNSQKLKLILSNG